jgi:hypothetical protein
MYSPQLLSLLNLTNAIYPLEAEEARRKGFPR